MKISKMFNNYKKMSLRYKQLYISFIFSIICFVFSIACLATFTYAWFTTAETVNKSTIDSGVIAVELFKSDATYETRTEINSSNPLFSVSETVELGDEMIKQLVVSNHGTLEAEYNLSIEIESINAGLGQGSTGNIGEIIDVFIAKYDKTNAVLDTYIYLGTIRHINDYHHYTGENHFYVKGILDSEYDENGNENDHYEDYYSLKLKIKDKAEAKYQNCNIKINMELISNKKVDELCTIYALSNNNSFGLVLGGGTYYIDGEDTIELIPVPNKGYVFQKWEDNGSTESPRIISPTGNKTYKAIFVEDTEEYHEHTDDPFDD